MMCAFRGALLPFMTKSHCWLTLIQDPQPERVALLGWGYVKKKEGERASSQGSVAGLA